MILVDAHVHIHNCFNIRTFLDSAWKNFKKEATKHTQINNFSAFLLLTEARGQQWFKHFKECAQNNEQIGGWSFLLTNEHSSLYASHNREGNFQIVAGRQIVTAEKLEVLALVTDKNFPDGQLLIHTVAMVKSVGAIPVIPWGTGKWMGKRGKILRDFLHFNRNKDFFLGDNGGRPVFWPTPTLFDSAREKGIKILPGSDPLPLPTEVNRAGSFGCIINHGLGSTVTAEKLKQILHSEDCSISSYGTLLSPFSFFRNQLHIRFITSKTEPTSSS